jgi:antitoxin component YwqK of YwqJK toxin-antitoxin module
MPLLLRISLLFALFVAAQTVFAAQGKGNTDSTFTTYHENGMVKETGRFRNGEKHGKWREYRDNGIILKETKYKKGVFKWEHLFNDKGRLSQIRDRKGKIHKMNECGC